MRIIFLLLSTSFLFSIHGKANHLLSDTTQNDTITISGTVQDEKTKEALPFANVVLYSQETQVGIAQTDFDGKFKMQLDTLNIQQLKMVITFIGYPNMTIENLPIISSSKVYLLNEEEMIGCSFRIYKKPLIDISNTSTGITLDLDDIRNRVW